MDTWALNTMTRKSSPWLCDGDEYTRETRRPRQCTATILFQNLKIKPHSENLNKVASITYSVPSKSVCADAGFVVEDFPLHVNWMWTVSVVVVVGTCDAPRKRQENWEMSEVWVDALRTGWIDGNKFHFTWYPFIAHTASDATLMRKLKRRCAHQSSNMIPISRIFDPEIDLHIFHINVRMCSRSIFVPTVSQSTACNTSNGGHSRAHCLEIYLEKSQWFSLGGAYIWSAYARAACWLCLFCCEQYRARSHMRLHGNGMARQPL